MANNIKFHKVSALPAELEADSFYFVETEDNIAGYLTTSEGEAKDLGLIEPKFEDNKLVIHDPEDESKRLQFEVQSIESSQTRKILMPNHDVDLGMISKLLPARPDALSTKSLSIANTYSARQAGTGILHSRVIDNQRPSSAVVANFSDGVDGTLTALVDGADVGSVVLTEEDNSGTYQGLTITDNSDPYEGQFGKADFWKQLSARVQSPTPLDLDSEHSYGLSHSLTGTATPINFWTDNPSTASVVDLSQTIISASPKFISGVPSLQASDTISLSFGLDNAVKKHYHSSRVARVTSVQTSDVNVAPPVTPPSENSRMDFSSVNVTVNNNVYAENISVSTTGYNSKAQAGPTSSVTTGARVDTKSNELLRKESGTGKFPSTFGLPFNSEESLKTVYVNELQLIDGRYQIPAGNYTGNQPVAGPDYSSGMGSQTRWVTFQPTSLNNNLAFTLTLNSTQGSWSGIETSGLEIYAMVSGQTGWVDCNKAYPGVGIPSNDGDAAMVFADSTSTVKRVTLGQVRSGDLYIRIGFPVGSNKKFSSVSISNLS